MQRKPEISVITVHYKIKHEFLNFLRSLRKVKQEVSFELVVVDNDKNEKLKEAVLKTFPGVKYIASGGNIGYGRAVNLGVKHALGEYLFVINPDTLVRPGCITSLYKVVKSSNEIGMVGPVQLTKEGKQFSLLGSNILTPLMGMFVLSFLNKLLPDNLIAKNYWLKKEKPSGLVEVPTIPGTAFMIKHSLFRQLGGFDSQFFLYFDENDLCKRLVDEGYRNYIVSDAKIVHYWSIDTDLNEKTRRIFARSRFLYFKKHFGLLPAFIVDFFAEFGRHEAAFLAVLLVGFYFRFNGIVENFGFVGEIGDNLLAIRDYYLSGSIPLVGPPTSHPWLSFPPLYYWIFGPVLVLSGFNPLSHAYFAATFGMLTILANYLVVSRIFNKKVGLLSSFFISISPLYLQFTHGSRFFTLVLFFFYPFIWSLYRLVKGGHRYFFWIAFWLGVMLNFHFTPIIFLPVTFLLIRLLSVRLNIKRCFYFMFGLFLPLLPWLIYALTRNFEMLYKFLLWFPYRVLGFVGLYPSNTADRSIINQNINSLVQYFSELFIPGDQVSSLYVFVIVSTVIAIFSLQALRNKSKNVIIFTVLMWISVLLIFIHGSPPLHYYLPVFPIPIVVVSWFLAKHAKVAIVAVFILFAANFEYFNGEKWYFQRSDSVSLEPHFVPYKLQLEAVETIINHSGEKNFSLVRTGPYDQFENNYSQNYIYLLWWRGKSPSQGSQLEYNIYEGSFGGGEVIFSKGDLFVVVET